MSSDVGLKILVNERAAFRSVLEGAGYNNLDALCGMSDDTCRMIGEDAKAATLKIIGQRDELLSALELVVADMAPAYHDCTDDGLQECAWCIARAAIDKATT